MAVGNVWEQVLGRIEATVNSHSFYTWFKPTVYVGVRGTELVVRVPNPVFRDWLTKHYSGVITEALRDTANPGLSVTFVTDGPVDLTPDPKLSPVEKTVEPVESVSAPVTGSVGLNARYTFDTFIVGSSNQFAHAAARAVAEAPSRSYNPLFLYGGVGLGKTHLMHAVGRYVLSHEPGFKLTYISAERFMNEMINALRYDRIIDFRERYRSVDVLLVDDVQFIAGKEGTQNEFFHTFNALHNAQKQIVISSDRPPKEIGQLEERLRTRFSWGLITDIQPPDLETRLAILRKKSQQDQLPIPDDVLELIASRVSSNIRELEGALIRVAAFASLQRTEVTLELAQMVLKDLLPEPSRADITVGLIMSQTADYFSLSLDDLCSTSRTRQLVNARQIAMYLTRELTDLSLPKIGQAFGGRDHTTVIHATNKIGGLMQERHAIFDQVQELTTRIKNAANA